MRSIKKIHKAVYEPIADLITYRALPTASIDYIDPFLFLNHHGPQVYPPHNQGLPFGPHPHRGFETVTFIIDGDIYHKDSGGHEGTILPGGVQWMTAGSGLIHAEVSSEAFKKNGGNLDLTIMGEPSAIHKMAAPAYTDLQKEDIPVHIIEPSKSRVHIVSGSWKDQEGAYQSISDVHLSIIDMKAGGSLTVDIAKERNIFFYVIKGKIKVNEKVAEKLQLVAFDNDGETIQISSETDTLVLFGHALPYHEPVVSHGPFVMNTEEEIRQAFTDYRAGKMGIWRG